VPSREVQRVGRDVLQQLQRRLRMPRRLQRQQPRGVCVCRRSILPRR
jgi:hypothetical protein